jgi:hypothetical protein
MWEMSRKGQFSFAIALLPYMLKVCARWLFVNRCVLWHLEYKRVAAYVTVSQCGRAWWRQDSFVQLGFVTLWACGVTCSSCLSLQNCPHVSIYICYISLSFGKSITYLRISFVCHSFFLFSFMPIRTYFTKWNSVFKIETVFESGGKNRYSSLL